MGFDSLTVKEKAKLVNLLDKLQGDLFGWQLHNFTEHGLIGEVNSDHLALGVGEEAGELQHAQLKMSQGIRGDKQKHISELLDAAGDINIYLMNLLSRHNLRLSIALLGAWEEVSNRDWKKFPKNGVSE